MDISSFRRFSIYPPGDEKQRVRIQRFFMSAGFYGLCVLPVGLSVHVEILPLHVMFIWIACSIIGNGAIYATMRLNYNKRFRTDPSLTIPQLVLAISLVLYLQIFVGQARGGYLLAIMLAFTFGCFKLKTRQMIWLSVLTMLAYGATMPIIREIEGARFNPAVELTIWVAFSMFLPSLALVAGSFSELRKRLLDANQKLLDLNHFDGLTGVKNRTYFNEKYDLEWRRSQRSNASVGLLMVDIDHFKQINDTYGHVGGDACLKRVAAIIREAARRPTDDAFRYGGEEFVVLLAATDSQGAAYIGEVIRGQIETSEIIFDGKKIPVTVSIGVSAMVPESGVSSDALIVKADSALYQAKDSGRNRMCVFLEKMSDKPD